jgi:membrane protease YdiL (CAAX protease family)
MQHPQTFVVMMVLVSVAFALLIWSGSLWGALGALVSGFALAFVVGMAWLWSPRSGVARGRRPTRDSFHGLR